MNAVCQDHVVLNRITSGRLCRMLLSNGALSAAGASQNQAGEQRFQGGPGKHRAPLRIARRLSPHVERNVFLLPRAPRLLRSSEALSVRVDQSQWTSLQREAGGQTNYFLRKGIRRLLPSAFTINAQWKKRPGEAIRKGTCYRITGATSMAEKGQPPLLGGWPSFCFI